LIPFKEEKEEKERESISSVCHEVAASDRGEE